MTGVGNTVTPTDLELVVLFTPLSGNLLQLAQHSLFWLLHYFSRILLSIAQSIAPIADLRYQ